MQINLKLGTLKEFREDDIYRYAFISILGLAVLLCLMGLNKGIWLDEGATYNRIYTTESIWTAIQKLRDYNKPPLYFLLLHFWSKINNSEAFLRLPSVFFGIATIFLVMKWMQSYSKLASILTGIYFATSPIFLRFSQEIRPYSLLLLATVIVFFSASTIVKDSRQKLGYISLAFGLSLASLTHLVGGMLIPTICVFIVLISLLEQKSVQWIKTITAIAIPLSIFIFIKYFYLNNINYTRETWWMPSLSSELVTSTINYVAWFSSLDLNHPSNHIITFAVFASMALLAVFGNFRHNFPFLVAGIFFNLQIIIYSWLVVPIFWYRTILPSLIPIVVFVVLQITTIRHKRIQKILIVGFVLLSLIFAFNWIKTKAWQPVEANKPVAQLLKSQVQNQDLILFYPNYIQDSIQYYLTDLPNNVNILSFGNLAETDLKFTQNKSIFQNGYSNNIFLVIRTESDNRPHLDIYTQILDVIKSKFLGRSNLIIFVFHAHHLPLIPDFEIIPKMLNILKSKLGKPSYYEDFKTYSVFKYF